MKIRKAIFPAAGFGTRFLPVTKAQPKEMLPIVDKPVIQYLVEEAVASGISEIIIVTGRGKRAIEDHFDYSYELEKTLVERGHHKLLDEVKKIPSMAKFVYVRQPTPKGDGHAVLCAKDLVSGEPFAVLFGDDLVDSKEPALRQLIKVYEKVRAPVIALTRVPKSDIGKYGVVKFSKKGNASRLKRITGLVEKPKPSAAPSEFGIIGKYILTPEFLAVLEKSSRSFDSEIRLIDGFRKWAALGRPVFGYEVEGVRYDTGEKFGFVKATIDFALKRADIAPQLKRYLKGLDMS